MDRFRDHNILELTGTTLNHRIKQDLLLLAAISILCALTLLIPVYQNSSLLLIPRNIGHLPGILFTFLFHADKKHLLSNLSVFIPISLCIIFSQPGTFRWAILSLVLISGVLLWCVGSPGIHLGASGVVIALCFYIVFRGILTGSWKSFTIAIIIICYNIFLFMNFWRLGDGISTDYHICGAFSGILLAIFNTKALRKS